MDEVAALADRMREKMRRGEEPGLEFLVDFASLTPPEQDDSWRRWTSGPPVHSTTSCSGPVA